jgi:hypothetical protein
MLPVTNQGQMKGAHAYGVCPRLGRGSRHPRGSGDPSSPSSIRTLAHRQCGALLVLLLPGATHGLLPFTAIMAVEMLVTTCLIIAAGVITESQAWVTVAILCSSLGINILGYVFAHLSGISAYMLGMRVRWTGTAWTVLIAELLMVPPASGDDLLHPIQEDRFSLMTKAHLY